MAATAVSAVVEFFKRKYITKPEQLTNFALKKHPLLNMIRRVDDFDGEGLYATMNYALPTGAAGGTTGFTTAQANYNMPTGFRIFQQRKTLYAVTQLKGETIEASRKDVGALLRMADKAADETLKYIGLILAKQLVSDGAGDIGQVLSFTGSTITLTSISDAINFHEGQWIIFNPTRTGTAGNQRGAAPNNRLQVSAVNDTTGVITFTQTIATIAGGGGNVANADYTYIEGTYDTGMTGIPAFVPATDPTGGENFLGGGSRAKRPNLLAGWRGTWRGTIEDSVKALAATMSRYVDPGNVIVWLSANNWYRLEMEAGARAIRNFEGRAAKMGYLAVGIPTPIGTLECAMDPFLPEDTGYILDMESWELHTLKAVPHVITDDGQSALRVYNDDSVEMRFRAWYDLRCVYPGRNGRFPITP